MVRSAADATRFTPTTPYAFSKPPPRRSTIPLDTSAPPNETPQQKVARLREAARRAKLGQENKFDRMLAKGRVIADKAHRITLFSLLGISVVTGVFCVVAVGDMIIYNRRKRKEWLIEQRAKHAEKLAIAYEAEAAGTADADQMLLINQQRAFDEHQAAEKAKKEAPGVIKRLRNRVFGPEGQQGGTLAAIEENKMRDVFAADNQEGGRQELGVLKAVEESRNAAQEFPSPAKRTASTAIGGPLDQTAENATEAVKENSKGWSSWFSGR